MSNKLHVLLKDEHYTIPIKPNENILETLQNNGISIPSPCGGNGTCGKCIISIIPHDENNIGQIYNISNKPDTQLSTIKCLACQVVANSNDISIQIHSLVEENSSKNVSIVDTYENSKKINFTRYKHIYNSATPTVDPYGIAIDIGTTTIAFELLNMVTGAQIAIHSRLNRQSALFGADVITRISKATNGAQLQLHLTILYDLCNGIHDLLNKANIIEHTKPNNHDIFSKIKFITITGNTTMLHILLNMPCNTLGSFPFTPVSLKMEKCKFADLFKEFTNNNYTTLSSENKEWVKNNLPNMSTTYKYLDCETIIMPGISTFVGADIVSGLLYCDWQNALGYNLFIDLGTNGEMVLFSRDKVLVTSAAVGPAFEGGNISCGVASVAGAIAKVTKIPSTNLYSFVNSSKSNSNSPFACVFNYETINNTSPIGICGTGVVDITSELIKNNIIDETGRFCNDENDNEVDFIEIAPKIKFTQRDIREVQLAKSAMRCGIEILIETLGITYNDINKVYLAGGFGYEMNLESAVVLGLIPPPLKDKILPMGNTALGGCSQILLDISKEDEALALTSIATELCLATHPRFSELFMEHISM